jgi:hypothetical protein
MRPLRRCAVLLVLLLAAACGDAGPSPDRVLSAAGAASEEAPPEVPAPSSTTTSTAAAAVVTTTTKRPAPVTTSPPTTVARTRTTRPPATPTPPIDGYSPAPPPPGVEADGYGGYGGVTHASNGGVELELMVYPREQYLGEMVQVGAQVSKPDSVAITSVKIDFGNGHLVTGSPGLGWYCGPSTYHAGASTGGYVYPAPGTYTITATVTFVACMGMPGMWIGPHMPPPAGLQGPWFPEPHQAVSASMGMLQRPDRHPPPVGPPPGP